MTVLRKKALSAAHYLEQPNKAFLGSTCRAVDTSAGTQEALGAAPKTGALDLHLKNKRAACSNL